jgi:hypothetical protein
MKPSNQADSPMDMNQPIEEISRRRFLGITAMGVAAAELGMIGSPCRWRRASIAIVSM